VGDQPAAKKVRSEHRLPIIYKRLAEEWDPPVIWDECIAYGNPSRTGHPSQIQRVHFSTSSATTGLQSYRTSTMNASLQAIRYFRSVRRNLHC